ELRQHRPFIYQVVNQTPKEVSGRFVISAEDEVSFDIGEYDAGKPLIIDPAFVFSTYFGGGAEDIGYSVARDAFGNSYVAGATISTNFPTANPAQSNNRGFS